MLCLCFKDYWSFLSMRAAIGFGEAGFSSIAPAVLGDMFGEERRTAVLGLFYLAIPIGW